MSVPASRILYATPECAPLVKTGGLGDVAGALPVALRQIGLDARVILPGYPPVVAALTGARKAGRIDALARLPEAWLLKAELPQGIPAWVADLGLPAASFAVDGVEYHGRISFLKAGLFYANAITTVSPTYAGEIQHEAMGMGMHGLLAARRDRLTGILNGIDTTVWDPANDPLIAARYDATTLRRKNANKKALQIRFGLETPSDILLLGAVTRLTTQKGVDLLLDIVEAVLRLPAQIVIVATGDKALERRLRTLTA